MIAALYYKGLALT